MQYIFNESKATCGSMHLFGSGFLCISVPNLYFVMLFYSLHLLQENIKLYSAFNLAHIFIACHVGMVKVNIANLCSCLTMLLLTILS